MENVSLFAIISLVLTFVIATAVVLGYVSRKTSRRKNLDELKLEIVTVLSSETGRSAWTKIQEFCNHNTGGVKAKDLAHLLPAKYKRESGINSGV